MKPLAGCLLALVAAPLLVVLLVLALAGAIVGAFASLSPFGRGGGPAGLPVQAIGPVYHATIGGRPTIHDLGAGSSDAARLDAFIARLAPQSPLIGQGQLILHLGQSAGIDPLLIVVWKIESQMATVGLNVPGNGGNMIWEAMLPYAGRWGCTSGPSSLGHHWGACPTLEAGLGIWFAYVSDFYPKRGASEFYAFANIYNPCSDPQNAANGLPCGDIYAALLLGLVADHAGAPVTADPLPAPGPLACVPTLPVVDAGSNLALPPGVQPLADAVFAGRRFPVTHGWGISDLAGEPAYRQWPHFHQGVDWGAPAGTTLAAPAAGVVSQHTGVQGNQIVDLLLPSGYSWRFLHLTRGLITGTVTAGQPIALSGNTGYSEGAHLHLELVAPSGERIAPEQWTCLTGFASLTTGR